MADLNVIANELMDKTCEARREVTELEQTKQIQAERIEQLKEELALLQEKDKKEKRDLAILQGENRKLTHLIEEKADGQSDEEMKEK